VGDDGEAADDDEVDRMAQQCAKQLVRVERRFGTAPFEALPVVRRTAWQVSSGERPSRRFEWPCGSS
jgi:hypothetical protein